MLKFLIDTGANKNFISESLSENSSKLGKPFSVQSAGGKILITKLVQGRFFQRAGNNAMVSFHVLPGLRSFDGIIGDDTLKELEAVIDRKRNLLLLTPNIRIPLFEKLSKEVNVVLDDSLPGDVRRPHDRPRPIQGARQGNSSYSQINNARPTESPDS